MPTLDEGPIIELGKNPIAGDAPCGADPGDDMDYIEVDAEMNKLGRIEAEEPDWYRIEQGCNTILKSVAKDVEVASWYGHALFKRYGYAGLAAALGLITELIRNFWDNVHPARPRRRKARIETLADQFTEGEWFRDNQPSGEADFDALDLCLARTEELNEALTEKMPDDPPDFKKFTRGLKGHADKRPKPEAPAPAATPSAEAAAAPSAPAAAGAFTAGEVKDVSGAMRAVLNACTFLRDADPTDPIPYAVVRIVKWSKICMPVTEEAKFQIPPPEKTTVEALAHQLANNLWEHLLQGAEAAFRSEDPLWLDLQRYTCAALSGFGPSYETARQAVMIAMAGLINRLGDGLFELKFSTGMPLCSGETKMWIETEVLPAQGGGGEAGGGGTADGRLAEAIASAKKLAGSGKLKEGLKELQGGLSQCMQRRDRFLWRLSIARLCFEAQRHQLAAPLLEQCYDDVQRFNIDDWEPSLAASVAETLYRCRKSLASAQKEPLPEDLKSVRDSFAWLCRLDPLAALAAEPSGK